MQGHCILNPCPAALSLTAPCPITLEDSAASTTTGATADTPPTGHHRPPQSDSGRRSRRLRRAGYGPATPSRATESSVSPASLCEPHASLTNSPTDLSQMGSPSTICAEFPSVSDQTTSRQSPTPSTTSVATVPQRSTSARPTVSTVTRLTTRTPSGSSLLAPDVLLGEVVEPVASVQSVSFEPVASAPRRALEPSAGLLYEVQGPKNHLGGRGRWDASCCLRLRLTILSCPSRCLRPFAPHLLTPKPLMP